MVWIGWKLICRTLTRFKDVADAIESQKLGTRDIDVAINQNGLTLDFLDGLGGTLRVEEVGSGLTAGDLGIRTTGAASITPVVAVT